MKPIFHNDIIQSRANSDATSIARHPFASSKKSRCMRSFDVHFESLFCLNDRCLKSSLSLQYKRISTLNTERIIRSVTQKTQQIYCHRDVERCYVSSSIAFDGNRACADLRAIKLRAIDIDEGVCDDEKRETNRLENRSSMIVVGCMQQRSKNDRSTTKKYLKNNLCDHQFLGPYPL